MVSTGSMFTPFYRINVYQFNTNNGASSINCRVYMYNDSDNIFVHHLKLSDTIFASIL